MLFTSGMPLSIDQALTRFGLSQFRPGQREIIHEVLSGRPTIAVLPTGAGKSLCYQLPAVALEQLAVVVSPLISLMKDQVDALTARGIPAAFINSSIPPMEREARLRAAVRGELRLLYVAPERFRAGAFTEQLARARPGLFAVDEAHCMVEWGHDFRPDYARLGEVRAQLGATRLVALTATATPDVRRGIAEQLAMDGPAVFVRGFDRGNLRLSVMPVQGGEDKLRRVLALLHEPDARTCLFGDNSIHGRSSSPLCRRFPRFRPPRPPAPRPPSFRTTPRIRRSIDLPCHGLSMPRGYLCVKSYSQFGS